MVCRLTSDSDCWERFLELGSASALFHTVVYRSLAYTLITEHLQLWNDLSVKLTEATSLYNLK